MNEPSGGEGFGGGASFDVSKIELGILAAKELCERLNGQVIDYDADGTRTSIRIRIPSRAERFRVAMERSRRLEAESYRLRYACRRAVERANELGKLSASHSVNRVPKRQAHFHDPTENR